MKKHEIEAAIELNFYDESILLLGAHEKDQVSQWLSTLQKAKKFVEWFFAIKGIIGNSQSDQGDPLSDQLVFKLQQIVDFCQS